MTTLASHPLSAEQLDILDAIADTETPLGMLRFEDFKAACIEDGERHQGWVNPNRVSAILHARFGEIDPRSYSAKWGPACGSGPRAFMTKTDVEVPIESAHSKGNSNKGVRMRRLRVVTT